MEITKIICTHFRSHYSKTQDMPNSTTSHTHILALTNFCLTGFKAYPVRENSHVLLGTEPPNPTSEILLLRSESININLLNHHNSHLILKLIQILNKFSIHPS